MATLNTTNIDSLLLKLENILKETKDILITNEKIKLKKAFKMKDQKVKEQANNAIIKKGLELDSEIIKDSRFLGNSERLLRSDGYATFIYPRGIGIHLLRRAIEINSAVKAISWLQKFLHTTKAECNIYQAIWGISIKKNYRLIKNVSLIPISNLPTSRQKEFLSEDILYKNYLILSPLHYQKPEAILKINSNIDPHLCKPDSNGNCDLYPFENDHKKLRTIGNLLSLAISNPIIFGPNWFIHKDKELEIDETKLRFWVPSQEEIIPKKIIQFEKINLKRLKNIVSKFYKLEQSTQNKVELALNRFTLGLMRHNPRDSFIEISIAFESLITDSSKSDVTSKLANRVAKLIGGKIEDRFIISETLRKFYSIRSTIIHEGVLTNKKIRLHNSLITNSELLSKSIEICSIFLEKVICETGIPDWKKFDLT